MGRGRGAPIARARAGGIQIAGTDYREVVQLDDNAFVESGFDRVSEVEIYTRVTLTTSTADEDTLDSTESAIQDLIANRVPALYVSRDGFREEPLLVHALETEARVVALERTALDALDLAGPLDRLLALDRPWSERRLDGAEVIARRVLELAARPGG